MVLAEFDTDADAVKALTVTALKDPSRLDHLVAQLRRERDDRAAYEQVPRQVTESGYLWSSWRTAGGSPTTLPPG